VRATATVLGIFTLAGAVVVLAQPGRSVGAPETFTAKANVVGPGGAAAATLQIIVKRYTPDPDRTAVEGALKSGGYPAFLSALRRAPDVGYVEHGPNQFAIRYARETKTPKGRTIVVVTDKPVVFVGGAAPNAKPRAGFEVAVLRFDVDDVGLGEGQMAGAARVKPGPDGGVVLDDYAEEPIKLVTVTRKLS
jgi:hypothetical protein